MNGKEVVERALSLGEAVHGSEREKAILKLIEGSLDREVKWVPVRTKVSSALSSEVRASGTTMSRSSGGFPTQSWGNSAGLCGSRRYSLARPSSSGVSGCEDREAQSNVRDGTNYIYVTLRTLPPR
ncbi:hypothetical protein DDW10_04085 [Sulfolobales archaeon SCGC AB-777_J03]|nr:hypothetical protein DDW10_04085 [Sulfolobales archaeon SCGC AB-777_J03]